MNHENDGADRGDELDIAVRFTECCGGDADATWHR